MRRSRLIDIVPSVQSLTARDPETGSLAEFVKRLDVNGNIEYVCVAVSGEPMTGKFKEHVTYSTPFVVSALSSIMTAGREVKCRQAELVMLFDEDTRSYFSHKEQ